MLSSTKAPTVLVRPTTDHVSAPTDKSVVTSEITADKVCHGCRKPINAAAELMQASSCAAACNGSAPDCRDDHFVCNICLDGCQDPVVTHCGHLFCWPCLFCRLSQQAGLSQLQCPVCKANVQDKIIPLYDHGHSGKSNHSLDPDVEIPCRPLPSGLSNLPATMETVADMVQELLAGRDADFSSGGDDQWSYNSTQSHITDGMQYHRNYYNARRGDLPTGLQHRFSSKEMLVLHWAFICMASIATVCFAIAC